MNNNLLRRQNLAFQGQRGISQNNGDLGYRAAFREEATGQIELARHADGQSAPMHLISGLPRDWGKSFADDGSIQRLKAGIVAGFELDGRFFTRQEVAQL